MKDEAKKLFAELEVEIDPDEKVEELTPSQKQLLEISKALFFNAKLLILDKQKKDQSINVGGVSPV